MWRLSYTVTFSFKPESVVHPFDKADQLLLEQLNAIDADSVTDADTVAVMLVLKSRVLTVLGLCTSIL